jgi:reactive chlorine resistance protein C
MKAILKKSFLAIAQFLFRYGLGIILIWLGVMKFKNSEALHIENAMAQTFLFKWMLKYVTIYAFSMLIAWIQILAGLFIMLKPVSSKLAAWGGAFAMIIFLAGILVFFTSGVVWQVGYGFPELSRAGHSFLKDFVLFAAAAWCYSDSL